MTVPSAAIEAAQRVERIGDATLLLGDCLAILPHLGPVDAVVTDPPFNSGRENIENDCLGNEGWMSFCTAFASSLSAENILVEVGKNDAAMRSALDARHPYRWAICLNYTNAMRQGAVGYSNTGLMLWYGNGKCHNRYMDRIDAPLENTIHAFAHPSPKTTAHYRRIVEMFSRESSRIADPFMGSGTTGVACAKLGREFVGIEINAGYFDIACRRIEAAYRQPDMFIERPAPAVQEPLFPKEAAE